MQRARIVNLSKSMVLAERAEVASGFLRRGLGLIGRRDWSRADGLVLDPCSSIHCLFMRLTIDALFVGSDQTVRKAAAAIRPWSLAILSPGSRYVVELPAGTIARTGTARGDRIGLELLPHLPGRSAG